MYAPLSRRAAPKTNEARHSANSPGPTALPLVWRSPHTSRRDGGPRLLCDRRGKRQLLRWLIGHDDSLFDPWNLRENANGQIIEGDVSVVRKELVVMSPGATENGALSTPIRGWRSSARARSSPPSAGCLAAGCYGRPWPLADRTDNEHVLACDPRAQATCCRSNGGVDHRPGAMKTRGSRGWETTSSPESQEIELAQPTGVVEARSKSFSPRRPSGQVTRPLTPWQLPLH